MRSTDTLAHTHRLLSVDGKGTTRRGSTARHSVTRTQELPDATTQTTGRTNCSFSLVLHSFPVLVVVVVGL